MFKREALKNQSPHPNKIASLFNFLDPYCLRITLTLTIAIIPLFQVSPHSCPKPFETDKEGPARSSSTEIISGSLGTVPSLRGKKHHASK